MSNSQSETDELKTLQREAAELRAQRKGRQNSEEDSNPLPKSHRETVADADTSRSRRRRDSERRRRGARFGQDPSGSCDAYR